MESKTIHTSKDFLKKTACHSQVRFNKKHLLDTTGLAALFHTKRLFDLLFSLIILIFCAPLFLFIALGIKMTSKGFPIYAQLRLGKGGKVFKCYKFRTMYPDADRKLRALLAQSHSLKAEWDLRQKLYNDPRICPFGKWLRRTSLDELPQFWNVLKGDLSVVGPRPYMVSQRREMEPYIQKILSVKPGITGLWQTSGRSQTSFHTRLMLDLKYLEKSSFSYDLSLILKTVPLIFFTKNAY